MTAAARNRRIGVMGGTFDPIHHGHLVAASEVQAWFDLDEVVFVPTGNPWQKSREEVSPAEHRYLMTVIATASNPRFTVSRVDIDRQGPTYTIDTLRDLQAARPEAELFFITGADALAQILSWKDVHQLWPLAHFVGVTRPGHELRGTGNGPIAAFANALESLGIDFEVQDYSQRSRTAGDDADAVCYIYADVDGATAWGVGIAASTTRASLKAITSAVNRGLTAGKAGGV